jgi:hypothetical protein
MRTITISAYEKTLYKFEELSESAKDQARARYQGGEWHWSDDAMRSLKAFAKAFGSDLADWRIDFGCIGNSRIKFREPGEWSRDEIQAKLGTLGSFDPETLKGHGDCKLTGVCFDENALDGFREAFFKSEDNDLMELLRAGGKSWLAACALDYEYSQSEEAFKEDCKANNWEFDERGDMV